MFDTYGVVFLYPVLINRSLFPSTSHIYAHSLIYMCYLLFIAGTYMTFLNTINNLGSIWPSSLALWLLPKLTIYTGMCVQFFLLIPLNFALFPLYYTIFSPYFDA